MTFADEHTVRERYNIFRTLKYAEKVTFFDQHFGVLPFAFPVLDNQFDWYVNPDIIKLLTDLFYSERRESAYLLYMKTITIGSSKYEFNILPVNIPHRKYFNEYILEKFLSEKIYVLDELKKEMKMAVSKNSYISEKISVMANTLTQITQVLNSNQTSLQSKFLQVYNNGIIAANSGSHIPVKLRRKFVEIYLYAKGYLFMEIYNFLLHEYEGLPSSSLHSISLRMKILLMHQLGLIDILKQKFTGENGSNNLTAITKIISLITNDGTIRSQQVFNYLSTIGTGHPQDCLKEIDIRFLEEQLKSIIYTSDMNNA